MSNVSGAHGPRIRAAITASEPAHAAVVQHVRDLLKAGETVVWASFNREYSTLKQEVGDQPGLVFIDATGTNPEGLVFTRDVMFVPSPTMLELVVLRLRTMAQRNEARTIVIEDLGRIDVYSGRDAVGEFCHYLANECRLEQRNLDLVVPGGNEAMLRVAQLITSKTITLQA